MKATDLMIGDWVNYQPGDTPQYMKVGMVSGYDIQLDLYREGGIEVAAQVWFDEENYIQPIPLTPEILEKNGFIIKHPESEKRTYWRDCAGQIVGHKNRGLMLMEIHGNPKKFGYFIPYFKGHLYYVHELQHALRLCGIEKEIEL